MSDEDAPVSVSEAPVWFGGIGFWTSLKWLGAGVLLYALLLLVAMAGKPADATYPIVGPSLYLTPMFGLPYVLATLNRPGRTRRMLYFLVLLPVAHVIANYLAWSYAVSNFDLGDRSGDLQRDLLTGGFGGIAGAALSFALLQQVQLTPLETPRRWAMLLGVLLLTALGAGTMAFGLWWTDALRITAEPSRAILWYEIVHPSWQLVFALFLAWLMRPVRGAPVSSVDTAPATPVEDAPPDASAQAVAERMRGTISAE